MNQFDWKLELQKAFTSVVQGLLSRTFWSLVIVSVLYIKKVITEEQYHNLAIILAGGTQLPKLVDVVDAIVNKPAQPKPPVPPAK